MIFESLAAFHDELVESGRAARVGYTLEKIAAEVVIASDGQILECNSFVRKDGKFEITPRREVPAANGRTSGISSNLFWDKTAYVFGVEQKLDAKKKPILDDQGKKIPNTAGRVAEAHAAFKALHARFAEEVEDEGLKALNLMLSAWTPDLFLSVFPADLIDGNVVFRLAGDVDETGAPRFLHQRPALRQIFEGRAEYLEGDRLCVVTGERQGCLRIHPTIKGIRNAQSSGAKLVSSNFDALESYGLQGLENSPVGRDIAEKAMSALNAMTERDSGHSFVIGDTTYIYWSDRRNSNGTAAPFDASAILTQQMTPTDLPTEVDHKLDAIFEGIRSGQVDPSLSPDALDPVCVLGLSGNASRLVVRSWMMLPPSDLFARVLQHANDCKIDNRARAPKPWSMLLSCANKRDKAKIDRLPPDLGRGITEAILKGTPYPRALLPILLRRLRAERDDPTSGHSVISPDRIAVLRALLQHTSSQEKIPMTLDKSYADTGYQLGRLFALIELAQLKAVPNARATVRDRMMSAASTTPRSVFPNLMRNANPHLGKLRKNEATRGFSFWLNRQIAEAFEMISGDIPRTLNIEAQARFFAGYYQQAHGARVAPTSTDDVIETPTDTQTDKDQSQ